MSAPTDVAAPNEQRKRAAFEADLRNWQGKMSPYQHCPGYRTNTAWFVDADGIPTRLHGDVDAAGVPPDAPDAPPDAPDAPATAPDVPDAPATDPVLAALAARIEQLERSAPC